MLMSSDDESRYSDDKNQYDEILTEQFYLVKYAKFSMTDLGDMTRRDMRFMLDKLIEDTRRSANVDDYLNR